MPAEYDGRRYRCWGGNMVGDGLYSAEALLTVRASGWAEFLARHFSAAELGDPALAGPNADPDGDGVANLLEYGFARNPRVAEGLAAVAFVRGGGGLSFTFNQSHGLADSGFALQRSDDLATWADVPAAEIGSQTEVVDAATDRITLTVVDPGLRRQFYRLILAPR